MFEKSVIEGCRKDFHCLTFHRDFAVEIFLHKVKNKDLKTSASVLSTYGNMTANSIGGGVSAYSIMTQRINSNRTCTGTGIPSTFCGCSMSSCDGDEFSHSSIIADLANSYLTEQISTLELPDEYMQICKQPELLAESSFGCVTNHVDFFDINLRHKNSNIIVQFAFEISTKNELTAKRVAVISV